MRLTETKAELRAAAAIRPRAVVMTMGALHDGHAACWPRPASGSVRTAA